MTKAKIALLSELARDIAPRVGEAEVYRGAFYWVAVARFGRRGEISACAQTRRDAVDMLFGSLLTISKGKR